MSDVRVLKDVGIATAYGYAVAGGYTGTEEEFAELMAHQAEVAQEAEESAEKAETEALKSEGNAVGKQDDTDVEEGSPYYHNNAKYYAGQAAGSATAASESAGQASGSANTAAAQALKAEGHAVGKQNGTDVEEGSPYYHNNSKYFADQAAGKATEASESAGAAAGSATQAAASAATSAAMTGLAPQFDSTKAYSAGDYVLYSGTLYQFTSAHAAGAWTGTDAVQAVMSDGVSDLKSQLSDIGQYTGLFLEYDFADSVSGHYVGSDNAYQNSASFSVSAPINIKKGDVVVLYARGYLQSVAMIAQYNSTANTYKSLVPSVDSTERTYMYKATSDITIVLSYRTENAHTCTIYKNVADIAETVNSECNTIKKTGSTIEIKIKGGKFGYQLIKKTDATKNLDTWLINKTSANNVDLQVTSDIEGPMQLNGSGGVEADFIGGLHGDEKFTSATFVVDGTIKNPAQDWGETKFKNLTVFVTSNVYHADSNDIAFVRYKKLDFTGNVLTITNRWVCADSNGVNIVTATGCGIYSIDESKMTGYSTNYNNVFVSDQATDPNPKINQVQFLGPNYKIAIKALEGFKLENSKGRVARLSSASSSTGYRDKVYLYAWYAATAYHLDEGEDMVMSFSITCE